VSAGALDKRASGATVAEYHACMHARVCKKAGSLTIADPLPRLAGHLVADQGARSKPMWHVRWVVLVMRERGVEDEGTASVGVAATASMREDKLETRRSRDAK
jgi:hypothetical protein